MLWRDPNAQGFWQRLEPQRRFELHGLAVDPSSDGPVGSDLERRCRPLFDPFGGVAVPIVRSNHGDPQLSGVQVGART